tara:strand:- start:39 stop:197 length:159 start_codon:yes stop_codon:yes gene_type:complete
VASGGLNFSSLFLNIFAAEPGLPVNWAMNSMDDLEWKESAVASYGFFVRTKL